MNSNEILSFCLGMAGMPLSPELCSRIVQWINQRRGDLAALCLTCKAFQREAEIKLYETLMLGDPNRAHIACSTIATQERFGCLVRSIYLYQDTRRQTLLPRQFWVTVQGALTRMHNLEFLFICDPSFSNSWILDPTKIKFQLREAKLRFTWDTRLVKFLESQKKLRLLQNFDGSEDHVRLGIQPHALPALQVFDGPLMIAAQLVSCPLTHIQVIIDPEVAPQLLSLLPRLAKVHATLRGLNFLEMPDELVSKALSIVSTTCPNLRHIGLLPLPWHSVSLLLGLTLTLLFVN